MVESNPERTWQRSNQIIASWLEHYYLLRTVTQTTKDPPYMYMTLDIKFQLRWNNRMMSQGRIDEGRIDEAMAVKIEFES